MSDDEEKTAAEDSVISKYMEAAEVVNGLLAISFLSLFHFLFNDCFILGMLNKFI